MKFTVSFAILLISYQSSDCHGSQASRGRLNFFDIELLRYTAEGKRGNVMVSPASIRTTLAMLLEGAKDATATEIRNALRLSDNADDRRLELIAYLDALHVNASTTVLESANGVFVSKKLTLKKDYETAIKRDFSAEMTKMDFDDAKKASDLVNVWISQKTHGLIPTIVEPAQLAASVQMVLTNAMYFKSAWQTSFNTKRTHPDCFYRLDACEKVSMMQLETELPYAYVKDLKVHAVELPYEGGRHSMILLVPTDREGCEVLLRDLPFISLEQIRNLMHKTDVTLIMPKFTVDYSGDMIEPLSKMHINSLFTSNSNLTGIFDGTTAKVGSFTHKVHMSVDEKGTVAAAASSSVAVLLSLGGVYITVDRPFVFFIRDNELGIVLFEGKIQEPTAFVEPAKPVQANVEILPSKPPGQAINDALAVKPLQNDNIVFRSKRSVDTSSDPEDRHL